MYRPGHAPRGGPRDPQPDQGNGPLPTASGSTIEIPPGQDVEGPWFIEYDERKYGEIATPNDIWFVDSTTEFHWGSVAFWSPDAFVLGEED